MISWEYRFGDSVKARYTNSIGFDWQPHPNTVAQLRRASPNGRNDPCSCGSGKKFKNCHGRKP
jgi:uncharacterized protein YecA (UPF0149 family)